jgi:hypothetical protein
MLPVGLHIPKKKSHGPLKLVRGNLDRQGHEVVSSPPDEMCQFVADGLDMLHRLRQRAQRSESGREPDDDEAA